MARKSTALTEPPMPLTKATGPGGRPRRESEPPANPFATWLSKSKRTAEDLAKALGVSVSSIYNMRNGYFTPGRDLAVLIAKESRGKVSVDSWPPAKARSKSKPRR